MIDLKQRRKEMTNYLSPLVNKLLEGPFSKGLNQGTFHPNFVGQVFGEYRLYCASFPKFLGTLLARTDEEIARRPLIINLWEESGEGDLEKTHLKMLDRFLLAWSQAKPKGETFAPVGFVSKTATKDFCDDIQNYLATKSAPQVFGFIGPGTEEVTARQYELFVAGLRKYSMVSEKDLEFFSAHMVADVRHADLFWNALENVCKTEADWGLAAEGAKASLEMEIQFWANLTGGA